jgi:hypothetical protein
MRAVMHLGPLALAADQLAAVAAAWLFVAVGLHQRMGGDKASVVPLAAAIGFVVARLACIATRVCIHSMLSTKSFRDGAAAVTCSSRVAETGRGRAAASTYRIPMSRSRATSAAQRAIALRKQALHSAGPKRLEMVVRASERLGF